jgi:pimeloyl-ACP methyl ester carboxylesterase
LPQVLHTLAVHVSDSRIATIAGATHPMFEQAPQKFCEIVLEFLEA